MLFLSLASPRHDYKPARVIVGFTRGAEYCYHARMGRFGVRDEKERALRGRMEKLGLREEDIEEGFVGSGGPGGQNADRRATCVQLLHKPTGIVVKAHRERTQALNRFLARRSLTERLERGLKGGASPETVRREKIRKQKSRRKRRARGKAERAGVGEG